MTPGPRRAGGAVLSHPGTTPVGVIAAPSSNILLPKFQIYIICLEHKMSFFDVFDSGEPLSRAD